MEPFLHAKLHVCILSYLRICFAALPSEEVIRELISMVWRLDYVDLSEAPQKVCDAFFTFLLLRQGCLLTHCMVLLNERQLVGLKNDACQIFFNSWVFIPENLTVSSLHNLSVHSLLTILANPYRFKPTRKLFFIYDSLKPCMDFTTKLKKIWSLGAFRAILFSWRGVG